MTEDREYRDFKRRCGKRRKDGPKTTDLYWDCLCPTHYIHTRYIEKICRSCNAKQKDRPNSIAQEVVDMFRHKRSQTE